MDELGQKILDLKGKMLITESYRNRYEVLDEVLENQHMVVTRRLIFTIIEVIKLEKAISKDTEIQLNFAIENAIIDVFNGKRWDGW